MLCNSTQQIIIGLWRNKINRVLSFFQKKSRVLHNPRWFIFFLNNPGFCLVSWPQPLLLAQIPLLDRLQRLGRPQGSPHLRQIPNCTFLVSRVFGKRTQMAVEKVTDISKFVLNPAGVLKISPVPTQNCPGYFVTHPGTKVTLS